MLARAGTGSKFSGSGRARVLRLGTGSGSGFTNLSPKPDGLRKILFKPLVKVKSMLN